LGAARSAWGVRAHHFLNLVRQPIEALMQAVKYVALVVVRGCVADRRCLFRIFAQLRDIRSLAFLVVLTKQVYSVFDVTVASDEIGVVTASGLFKTGDRSHSPICEPVQLFAASLPASDQPEAVSLSHADSSAASFSSNNDFA
jgi:hypothetical protein